MKQILIVISFILIIIGCVPTTTMSIIEVPENVQIPNQVKFLSQSCDMNSLYQSVIDLSNNELIVLEYNSRILYHVYRTGIIINPDEHTISHGTSAPFSEPEEEIIDNDIEDEDDSDDDNNDDN